MSASTSCQNRNLTLGKFKHTRVGRSTASDAGWGLFVDEFVAKDEFLIEYIGEMVTHEEAERRGAVYDKLNRRCVVRQRVCCTRGLAILTVAACRA